MSKIEKYLIEQSKRPSWLEYPQELLQLLVDNRIHMTPWHLLEAEFAISGIKALAESYNRQLVPFAFRQDNDDLACFEMSFGCEVIIIHNHASKGWEDEIRYSNIFEWLKSVELDMADWA